MFNPKCRYWFTLFLIAIAVNVQSQNAKINVKQEGVTINNTGSSTPDPSAVLHVDALNKGVLFPRLTTVQRDAILTPAEGLLIYNLTDHIYEYFNGTEWRELGIPTVPTPAPTNLVASSLGTSQIGITWADNATNETGFLVERRLATQQTWTPVITLGVDITAYTDDNGGAGLSVGTTYVYRVRSLTNSGGDGYSNEASATTLIPFVSRWKTNNPGVSGTNQVQLPLEATGSYNFMIDWGDGSSSTITAYNQAEVTHTYATAGEYTLTIEGQLDGWRFANQGDKEKLLEISSWGELLLGNNGAYFHGCSNLVITATDDLNSGSITSFDSAWRGCSSLTSFPLIDVSAGTNFQFAWEYNTSLTSFPALDMSSATNLAWTWRGNSSMTSFGAITTTSQLTNIGGAWEGCSSLGSFPTIITNGVTNFNDAWRQCSSLTLFPALTTTAGTSFVNTWRNCTGLTSLPTLDLGAMTTGIGALFGTNIGTASYSDLLIDIESRNTNSNVTFDGGNATYNTAAATARANLVSNGWTITDGGAN